MGEFDCAGERVGVEREGVAEVGHDVVWGVGEHGFDEVGLEDGDEVLFFWCEEREDGEPAGVGGGLEVRRGCCWGCWRGVGVCFGGVSGV